MNNEETNPVKLHDFSSTGSRYYYLLLPLADDLRAIPRYYGAEHLAMAMSGIAAIMSIALPSSNPLLTHIPLARARFPPPPPPFFAAAFA